MDPEQKTLIENIPTIVKGKGKKLLYVGASKFRVYLHEELLKFGYDIDIIEIWPENVKYLKNRKGYGNIIEGDIRELDKVSSQFYDVVFWWHGPEHIKKEDLAKTLSKIESVTDLVILGCPTKEEACQGTVYKNIYETHLSSLEPRDFEKLGYKVCVISRYPHSDHLTAWKKINHSE